MKKNHFLLTLFFLTTILVSAASGKFFRAKKSFLSFPDAVKKIASSKPARIVPVPQKPDQLEILSARYGAEDQWLDVTDAVRQKVKDHQLAVVASNAIAGDPLYGHSKILQVEYILDGQHKTDRVREGMKLTIPPVIDPDDPLNIIETPQELIDAATMCPAEVGFYGKNFVTGKTVQYRPDQPACMASIVKIFVLLEIARQAENGTLKPDDPITIPYSDHKETCTINEAIDKMIGISDNQATNTLAARVGYDNVNGLPKILGLESISEKILPEPGLLEKVLNQRVYGPRLLKKDQLLYQHGTAKGFVEYFEHLHNKTLISESISNTVLKAMERNPKPFAPHATPADYNSVGKGGSLSWNLPFRDQYNMTGWVLYIYNDTDALSFCIWFERFPKSMSPDQQFQWTAGLSDAVVKLLLAPTPAASASQTGK